MISITIVELCILDSLLEGLVSLYLGNKIDEDEPDWVNCIDCFKVSEKWKDDIVS